MIKANLALNFLLILVGSWLISCNDPTEIGGNIIPGEDDILFVVDTLDVLAITEIEDSIRTDINITNHPIGSIRDDIFGSSYSSAVVPFELPSNNVDLGDELDLDSIVLTMPYNSVFGDSMAMHTFKVFAIEEELFDSIDRYSFDPVPMLSSLPETSITFQPNFEDSIVVFGEKIIPHLRIRLDDAVGNELLSYSGESEFENNEAFQTAFPGLFVEPDTTSGFSQSIIQFDLLFSSQAKLTIYYSNNLEDSLRFELPINSSTEVFSLYRNNLQGSQLEQDMNNPASTKLYLKGLQGTNIKLTVPGITDLGNIAINRAEFIFKEIKEPSIDDYDEFEQILTTKLDTSGLIITQDFF